jgi:hypothetical protein
MATSVNPTDSEWLAFLERARLEQSLAPGAIAIPNEIKGRFIVALVKKVVDFWGRHRAILVPALTQLAVAALDALAAAQNDIARIDPPGPA